MKHRITCNAYRLLGMPPPHGGMPRNLSLDKTTRPSPRAHSRGHDLKLVWNFAAENDSVDAPSRGHDLKLLKIHTDRGRNVGCPLTGA